MAAFLTAACSTTPQPPPTRKIPLPKLDASEVNLKVAYAVNPRLPQMNDDQLKILLKETQRTVHEPFQANITFSAIHKISIEDLFRYLPEDLIRNQKQAIFDFKNGTGDVSKLTKAVENGLRGNKSRSLSEMVQYARPYLVGEVKEESIENLASVLVETLLTRIGRWREISGTDGRPIINDSPYNEWVMWDFLGYGDLPYDIVLTNQLIASVEYYGQSVHS
ncbi:MAG: hypothetical protein GY866_14285 [Proteobacteria bacterium]|nr:hypothetical protein [Pseudomonadota bacterium]